MILEIIYVDEYSKELPPGDLGRESSIIATDAALSAIMSQVPLIGDMVQQQLGDYPIYIVMWRLKTLNKNTGNITWLIGCKEGNVIKP